jgi:membrane-bound lytic murein transglycosylase D
VFDNLLYITYLCTAFTKMNRSMNTKKMINKHLITCSVILVLAVIFKLNICSTSVPKTGAKISPRISNLSLTITDNANDYSFANEALPVNNAVYRKVNNSIKRHSYKHVQSHILQRLKPKNYFQLSSQF